MKCMVINYKFDTIIVLLYNSVFYKKEAIILAVSTIRTLNYNTACYDCVVS